MVAIFDNPKIKIRAFISLVKCKTLAHSFCCASCLCVEIMSELLSSAWFACSGYFVEFVLFFLF